VTSAFPDLAPEERLLVGAWVEQDAGTTHDEVDRRIFWLVTRRLIACGHAGGGWDQLYLDPRDGRFWELTFPQGSLHGGGPRRLESVDASVAREKYGVDERTAHARGVRHEPTR
jgi:hypothetical protein